MEERTISIEFLGDIRVCVLAPMGLFASKLNALISRAAVRDIYDVYGMIQANLFETMEKRALLRKILVFYLAVGSSCKAEEVTLDIKNIKHIEKLLYDICMADIKTFFDKNTLACDIQSAAPTKNQQYKSISEYSLYLCS